MLLSFARNRWPFILACCVSVGPVHGDGLFDGMKAGKHKHTRESHIFPRKPAANEPICDIIALVNKLDIIEEGLRDDGIMGIKTPDVWSQSRMTLYRREFEEVMAEERCNFAAILSARNARLDSASFENSFSLALALQGAKGGTGSDVSTTTTVEAKSEVKSGDGDSSSVSNLLKDGLNKFSDQFKDGIGIEPTVYLDQKKRYIDHLNELRRVNIGDDLADSAGYGLYLVRFPVSIQPGEKTLEGHGAELSLTVRPEMSAGWVADTFRQLVVEDVVDDFAPTIIDILRTWQVRPDDAEPSNSLMSGTSRGPESIAVARSEETPIQLAAAVPDLGRPRMLVEPGPSRLAAQTTIDRVFGRETAEIIAQYYSKKKEIQTPRYADLSNFLRKELKRVILCCTQQGHPMKGDDWSFYEKVASIENDLEECEFAKLENQQNEFLAASANASDTERLDTALTWLLMVRCALLNIQLKQDIARELYDGDVTADGSLRAAQFYNPAMLADNARLFEQYVQQRWPILVFAIDPVVDQQNVADSLSYRRDLQLAAAFALATGKMSVSNASKFTRSLQEDSETIALNRTVSSFAYGNETFGWRFYPRFQLPPNERNNVKVLADILVRGGRGRNYRIKNAKLEAGQRELTAVIVMPSFLRRVRFQVASNWFKLNQPDDMRITTARQLEQGRLVQELESVCAEVHNSGCYRPEDIEGVDARIRRLEAMLPMQTYTIAVPYENLLSGQELFVPGTSALSPRLFGYEGVDSIAAGKQCQLLLYGKHFSICETVVIAGGQKVDFKVISRDLMEVDIPENVQPTKVALYEAEGASEMVEISISTATGISNRIYVPYVGKTAEAAAPRGSIVSLSPEVMCYQRSSSNGSHSLVLASQAHVKFVVEDECDVYPSCVHVKCEKPAWEGKGTLNLDTHCYEIEAQGLIQQVLDQQLGNVDCANPAKSATIGPFTISQNAFGYEFSCKSGNTLTVQFREDPCAACLAEKTANGCARSETPGGAAAMTKADEE